MPGDTLTQVSRVDNCETLDLRDLSVQMLSLRSARFCYELIEFVELVGNGT